MIKYIDISSDDDGVEISAIHPGVMIKTAEFDPELADFLSSIKPNLGKYYLHINALGAGEYFGENRNGDFFPETALLEYHKTFETNANLYKHHQNKPHLGHKIYGKVLFSFYNKKMHRVELIVEFDTATAPEIKERIDSGENLAFSMGAKLKYDECSICGNKAKNLNEYCDHLKYQMRRTLADGRKVSAINRHPKFFDISFVTIPADRTAYMFSKVASVKEDGEIEEKELDVLMKSAEEDSIKKAEIEKVIPGGNLEGYSEDPKGLIYNSQPKMSSSLMDDLLKFKLNKVLSTLAALHIMPTKRDFQTLVLKSSNMGGLADKLNDRNLVFATPRDVKPVYVDDVNTNPCNDVLEVFRNHDNYLSRAPLTKPVISIRILEKQAEMGRGNDFQEGSEMEQLGLLSEVEVDKNLTLTGVKNPLVPLSGIAGLYYAQSRMSNMYKDAEGLKALMLNKPWLLPLFVGGASLATIVSQQYMNKTAGAGPGILASSMISVPLTYLYSGRQESKVRKGEPISFYGDTVRKHPFIMGITHGVLASKALNLMAKTASISQAYLELPENKFDEIYNTIIGMS